MRRRLGRVILLLLMSMVGISTIPNSKLFSKEFWGLLSIILLITIVCANIFLGEEQYELFNYISKENIKKAPIYAILIMPLIISTIGLIITGLEYLSNTNY